MDWRRQEHRHDIHQPDVHQVHERWRRIADRHDAFLVGEVYELDPRALARFVQGERLHSSFWFGLVETDWDADRIDTMIEAAVMASPRLSWVQGNHDRSRAVTRFGGGPRGRRRSLALHVLMALLPGTFWLYPGEELGETVAAQQDDPASHLHTLVRLLTARRHLAHVLASIDDVSRVRLAAPVTAYRRGALWAVANLRDTPAAGLRLPAPAVFDTDDPTVTPHRPRTGYVGLAPQQALLLAAE
ncbi:glycosidase [Nonomuraea rubra]|uniref:Glycosidase n=1 Tax=Nonomuraea rubra TaxID=46180 RepID=A0A7X0NWF8_9ACTN|nr:glycosidase [Nonomuraea rubra]